jgi:hypothetical protein
MKTYGGVDLEIHIFLTLATAANEWSVSCTALPPGRKTWVPSLQYCLSKILQDHILKNTKSRVKIEDLNNIPVLNISM